MDKAGTAPAAPDGPDILQTAPLRVIDPLHRAIAARAAQVPVPQMQASRLFRSTLMGGFECASQRHRPKQRLDLLASTGHARFAAQDYRALAAHGLRTVRDGLRWHLIERVPGQYDWSSFLPMLHAAHDTKTEVIWDLCHYGWPDALDIWAPDFPARFADFAGAAARVVLGVTGPGAAYVPINEISFWAWAGGSKGFINPHAKRRGSALKTVLLKAALAGIAAIRAADPQARIIVAEPAIHVIPKSARKADIRAARAYSAAQFEAVDALTGRARPELGGRPDCVDVVGLNYYIYNQWVDGGKPVAMDDLRYRPLRDLLRATHARYGKPLFLSETGIEGEMRAPWLRVIATEVAAAQAAGVPVEGLCLYPVTDYPGWGDGRHCETGLLGFPDAGGTRPVDAPLAQELARLVAALRP